MGTPAAPPHTPARAVFKNMAKGSALYMIAMISPALVSLILVPIVTRHLSRAEVGALDMLGQIGVVISVLLGLNLSTALGYFYFEPDSDKSRVVSTTLAGAVVMGTLAGIVGWMIAGPVSRIFFHSSDYVFYLRFVAVGMPLSFLLDAAFSWLRVEDRSAFFTGSVFLRLILILGGTLTLMLGFGLRMTAVLGANIAAVSVVAVVLASIAVHYHGFTVDPTLFKRIWRFSLPLSVSALGLFTIHFADRFVLSYYFPLDDLGLYTTAYKFGMLLSPIQTAFEAYWGAQSYQIIRRPDAASIFARTFTYLMLVMSFSGVAILVAAPPALHIMTPPAYFGAAALIPIILAGYYLRALGDFFRIVLLAKGLPTHDAICNWLTAGISLGLYFWLIPLYGIKGAALATLLTFAAAAVISPIWSYRVWPYQLETGRLAKIAGITAALVIVHFAMPPTAVSWEIGIGTMEILAFAGLLFAVRFPNDGEMNVIRSTLARVAAYAPW